jgi:putative transposase
MRHALEISERRACRLVGLSRTTLRRVVEEQPGAVALKARIIDLAHARRRFGYRRIHDLLRREGVQANHKRVYRLYRQAALSVRKRRRRKLVMADRQVLHVPSAPNEVWSIDFVMDALANGRRIKCLTIVDDFTRECASISPLIMGSQAAMWRGCWRLSASSGVGLARFGPIRGRNSPAVRWIAGLTDVASI